MKKLSIVFSVTFIGFYTVALASDCDKAVSTIEMRFCSAEVRREAEKSFKISLNRLKKNFKGNEKN